MCELLSWRIPTNTVAESADDDVCPTCDLGFDLALHLQRVHEDAAVADEASAGDASVRLAETLLLKILPVPHKRDNQEVKHSEICGREAKSLDMMQCTERPLEASVCHGWNRKTPQSHRVAL